MLLPVSVTFLPSSFSTAPEPVAILDHPSGVEMNLVLNAPNASEPNVVALRSSRSASRHKEIEIAAFVGLQHAAMEQRRVATIGRGRSATWRAAA